jgi:hypothetical protein
MSIKLPHEITNIGAGCNILSRCRAVDQIIPQENVELSVVSSDLLNKSLWVICCSIFKSFSVIFSTYG